MHDVGFTLLLMSQACSYLGAEVYVLWIRIFVLNTFFTNTFKLFIFCFCVFFRNVPEFIRFLWKAVSDESERFGLFEER